MVEAGVRRILTAFPEVSQIMVRQTLILAALLAVLAPAAGAADASAEAAERALAGLDSAAPGVRREAYAALGVVGLESDLPRLHAALYDEDRVVRGIAQASIWRLWGRSGDSATDREFEAAMEQMEAGKLQPAVRTLTRIIERRPSFTEAWNKRATAYFLLGENDRSIADCDQVLARNPLHFGALAGYGQLMLRKREPRRALDYFERALTVNPNMTGVAVAIEVLREALARRSGEAI
jgi:tetratricopeptide (TPR) repeat protein